MTLDPTAHVVLKYVGGLGFIIDLARDGHHIVTATSEVGERWTVREDHFKDNQARPQLLMLAYNLGNFLRPLALPKSAKHWSLTTLRERLIKIGAKVVRHAKHVTFQMAEVAVPHALSAAILERIQRFGVPPPLVQGG